MSASDGHSISGIVLAHPDHAKLARCIDSLMPVVNTVYVGTHDPSRDAAVIRSLGGQVVELSDEDRPDRDLNCVLDAVKERWCLRLDHNEWFSEVHRSDLIALVSSGASNGYQLLVEDVLPRDLYAYTYKPALCVTGQLKFQGRASPVFVDSKQGAFCMPIVRSNVTLRRDWAPGQDPLSQEYVALLNADISEWPNDVFLQLDRLYCLKPHELDEQRSNALAQVVRALETPSIRDDVAVVNLACELYDSASRANPPFPIPEPLTDSLNLRFTGKPRLTWAMAAYCLRVGEIAKASQMLRRLLAEANFDTIDFAKPMAPELLATPLYQYFSSLTRGQPESELHQSYANLKPPNARPNFTTLERGDSLWIERWMYSRLAQEVTHLGFRPDAYPRGLAVTKAEESGEFVDRFEWWTNVNELNIDARQCGLFATLLEDWIATTPDTPIPLDTSHIRPQYVLLDTQTRWRKCASELAAWLRKGGCKILLREHLRYAELQRS